MTYDQKPVDAWQEIHHHAGHALNGLIMELNSGRPNFVKARKRLCDMLLKFEDGSYAYPHAESFNPEVAAQLRQEAEEILQEGVEVPTVRQFLVRISRVEDQYAIETGQPERTNKVYEDLRKKLKAEYGGA